MEDYSNIDDNELMGMCFDRYDIFGNFYWPLAAWQEFAGRFIEPHMNEIRPLLSHLEIREEEFLSEAASSLAWYSDNHVFRIAAEQDAVLAVGAVLTSVIQRCAQKKRHLKIRRILECFFLPLLVALAINYIVALVSLFAGLSLQDRLFQSFSTGFVACAAVIVFYFIFYPPFSLLNKELIIAVHEVNHYAWAHLMGFAFYRFMISVKENENSWVQFDKYNIFSVLSPYFCPLIALITAGIFMAAVPDRKPAFAMVTGLFLALHLVQMTLSLLSKNPPQSDLQHYRIATYPLIILFNALFSGMIIQVVSGRSLVDFLLSAPLLSFFM